jgi:hypothetical protein
MIRPYTERIYIQIRYYFINCTCMQTDLVSTNIFPSGTLKSLNFNYFRYSLYPKGFYLFEGAQ